MRWMKFAGTSFARELVCDVKAISLPLLEIAVRFDPPNSTLVHCQYLRADGLDEACLPRALV
jgi:hypothetical protein